MDCQTWLQQLVAIDTTSDRSNVALIELIQNYLVQEQFKIRITHHPKEQKMNLLATLPGSNGSENGGILLSGHTDVVPVTGQQWDTDPFVATKKDDRIYGRGTADMKGFLAAMLAIVPQLQQKTQRQPLHFAFSYDEETGCHGAPLLIADMKKAGITPAFCIVGEPTDMHVVVGHKGIHVYRLVFHGRSAHSSLTTEGCNAIEHATKFIYFLRQLAGFYQTSGPFDEAYDVPFTTISTNMMKGGIATNIIPNECEVIFEFRHLPEVEADDIMQQITHFLRDILLPQMQEEWSEASYELKALGVAPSFVAETSSNYVAQIRRLLIDSKTHKVAYATEAGLFAKAGIPTIVCGPGNIREAHRANEFIEIAQLQKCETFLLTMCG